MDPFIFVGVEGNTYTSSGPLVYKIDPVTRTVVGSGYTSYAGAVSRLGLLSRDDSKVYISITNGIGAGTIPMGFDPPFPLLSGSQSGTNWYYSAVWNQYANVRAHMGYGAFVDLRGSGITLTTSLTGTPMGAGIYSRLVSRHNAPHVFAAFNGRPGVGRVDVTSGQLELIDLPFAYDVRSICYSEDTDTLYVSGRTSSISATHSVAIDAATLSTKAVFSPGSSQPTGFGEVIQIPGTERFVISASITLSAGELWILDFSSNPPIRTRLGSGGNGIALDPVTGYIWTGWRTSVTAAPYGGEPLPAGYYALVYNPLTLSLVDSIFLHTTGANFTSVIYTGDPPVPARRYPAALPGPSYYKLTPNRQFVAPEAGEVGDTARRRSRVPMGTADIGFRFLETDYAIFRQWYRTALFNGRAGFFIDLPSAVGMAEHYVRFIAPCRAVSIGYGAFEVNSTIELHRRVLP
jgi:hypothetical protein